MPLRFYQREAIEDTFFAWSEYRRVIGKHPTGSGKTHTASSIIDMDRTGKTLFIADQDELCDQPRRKIRQISGIISDLEKAKDRASLHSDVVVASAQTLSNPERLLRYPRNHFQKIIIDEAHRGTDRDIIIADHFPDAYVLGMTATPFRKNLADLSKWYPHVAFQMTMSQLVALAFAPRMERVKVPVEIDLDRVELKRTFDGKEYDLGQLDTAILPYYEELAKMIAENWKDKHTIAFLPLIKSSIEFSEILRSYGIRARHVDGQSKDRDEIIEGFARGDFNFICNSDVLSTGVDLPIADCLLDLSPCGSASKYQQRYGRVSRAPTGVIDHLTEENQTEERRAAMDASSKPRALILEVIYQNDRANSQHAGCLVADNKEEADLIRQMSDLFPRDLEEMKLQAQRQREAALVAAIDKAAARNGGKTFKADHVGAILGDPVLANYEPVNRWELDPPTDAQVKYLKTFGIDPESITCKGLAGKLLSVLPARRTMKMATLKQVQILRKSKMVNPERLTLKAATEEITKVFERRKLRSEIYG